MARKNLVSGAMALLLVGGLANTGWALKGHPYDEKFDEKFTQQFVVEGRVDVEKRDRYLDRLERKYAEVVGPRDKVSDSDRSLLLTKYRNGKRSNKKLLKKITTADVAIALNLAIEKVSELNEKTPLDEARKIIDLAWSLENSVRSEGDAPPIPSMLSHINAAFTEWSVKRKTNENLEAANLWDPRQQAYLDRTDIAKLLAEGADLSLYDPSPESYFWQTPKANVRREHFEGTPIYDGLHRSFAPDNVYIFDKPKLSDTKPKLKVVAEIDGEEREFKLKTGREIHSDPTVSALASLVGFHADYSIPQHSVKVIFKGKDNVDDLIHKWESYYEPEATIADHFPIENLISDRGHTEEGDEYLVFRQALLEPKPEELHRIGPWAFRDTGLHSRREYRGLTLFNIWVGNGDVKDAMNNRFILRDMGNDQYQPFAMHSDMGLALGLLWGEKPAAFPKNIIKRTSRREITFQFWSWQKATIHGKMSYFDAKWMARKIANLKREQIVSAIHVGKWPQCAENIYTAKLIHRRNQLVTVFEMQNEYELYFVDQKYLDMSLDEACGDLNQLREEYMVDMELTLGTVMGLAKDTIKEGIKQAARQVVTGFKRFTLNPSEVGFEEGAVAQVIVDWRRKVMRNPDSKDLNDKYLFMDSFEVGFRLGVAFGVFADRKITRKYTMVYPARRQEWTEEVHGKVVDFFLRGRLRNLNLPEKYVFITEDYADWRLGFRIDDLSGLISPGLEGGETMVALQRMVVDGRDKNHVYMLQDRADYFQDFFNGYLRVVFFKLPLFTWQNQDGQLKGTMFKVNKSALEPSSEHFQSLRRAIFKQDISQIDSLMLQPLDLESNFRRTETNVGFVFWHSQTTWRSDQITLKKREGHPPTELTQHQGEDSWGWKFLDRGERFETRVRSFVSPKPEVATAQYGVELFVDIQDLNTQTYELEEYYLSFMNGLVPTGEPLIPLTPSLGYMSNDLWGDLNHITEVEIYDEGLTNILESSEEEFWEVLANNLGVSAQRLTGVSSAGHFITRRVSERTWKQIKKARNSDSAAERSFRLARAFDKAIYERPGKSYQPEVLRALIELAGSNNVFIRGHIQTPIGLDNNFLEDVEPQGKWGQRRSEGVPRYIIFSSLEPEEVYFMLDPLVR